MKTFNNILNIFTIMFIIIYPILPSYDYVSTIVLLFLLLIIQILGLIFVEEERLEFLYNIKSFKDDKIILSALALNLLMYISTLFSVNKLMTIGNSLIFTTFILVYYAISYKIKDKFLINTLISGFLSVSVLSSLVSIYQAVKRIANDLPIDESNRIVSFLENSNNLGAYSILSIFIFIMLIFSVKKLYQKIIFLICSILQVINIILSQSRNALLGLIIGFVLLSFLYNKRFKIYTSVLFLILLIIPQSQGRLVQIFDMTQNSSRIKIWKLTGLIIKDNPILGTGYETYGTLYPIYIKENPFLMIRPNYLAIHPHNVLLKFQSELGILGTILLLIFIGVTTVTLINQIKITRNSISKSILIGITIAFISFNLMNLIDSYYNVLKVALTLFTVLGISNIYAQENKSHNLKNKLNINKNHKVKNQLNQNKDTSI